MFDQLIFEKCLTQYIKSIKEGRFHDEKYKWEAIKWFQEHWNIEAEDFTQMFLEATAKTYNLLVSANNFPRGMIKIFSEKEPETVRSMFKNLYDEKIDVIDRINKFQDKAQELLDRILPGKNHYQRAMAISVYLWLNNPNEYPIFKFSDFQEAAKYLKNDYIPQKGSQDMNLRKHLEFIENIRSIIHKNVELLGMINGLKDELCYDDPIYITLAHDIEIFISRRMINMDENGMLFSKYPAWVELERVLNELDIPYKTQVKGIVLSVIKPDDVAIYPRKDFLRFEMKNSVKNQYENIDSKLYYFKDVGEVQGRINPTPFVRLENIEKFISVLCDKKNEIKVSFWPTYEEYPVDLTKDDWLSFLEEVEYPNHKGSMRVLKCYMDIGGVASSTRLSEVYMGHPTVYTGSISNFSRRALKYFNMKPCIDYKDDSQWLFPIAFQGKAGEDKDAGTYVYRMRDSLMGALKEIDLSDISLAYHEEGNQMVNEQFDKNIILYGPPGTGKTYNTVKYAVAVCDGKNIEELTNYSEVMNRYNELKKNGRIKFTTFHQSYGYEEFIEGIRPVTEGGNVRYEVYSGVFKSFCDVASSQIITGTENYIIKEKPNMWGVKKYNIGNVFSVDVSPQYDSFRVKWSKNASKNDKETNIEIQNQIELLENKFEEGDLIFAFDKDEIQAIGVYENIISKSRYSSDEYVIDAKVHWLAKNNSLNVFSLEKYGKEKRFIPDNRLVFRYDYLELKTIAEMVNRNQFSNYELKVVNDERPYVFIIDEINRGNVSKIFGELITLIESSKRLGEEESINTILPCSREVFCVPGNVYIIGTMNTADRSIALLDTALRRRFSFIEMMPDSKVLRDIGADKVEDLDVAKILDTINERITFLYDREHTIGHAFFTSLKDDPTIDNLARIFKYSIIPLLKEYFYEDYQKIQLVLGDNYKSDERYKFITDFQLKVEKTFKGNVDDMIDLPEKKYEINDDALMELQSYKEII